MAGETIRRYRGKPAVLGWNPGDEPGANGLDAGAMFGRYDRFKRLDPDHLVYTVICGASRAGKYVSGTDVLVPDPYPVPEKPIGQVFSSLLAARLVTECAGVGLWSAPQAFGGQGYAKTSGWTRPPTGAEFRALSYLALMAGAKGLMSYVFCDSSFDMMKEPDLLKAVKALPSELKDVIPFVLNGRHRLLSQGEKGRYAVNWEMSGRQLSVSVDCSGNVPVTVVSISKEL